MRASALFSPLLGYKGENMKLKNLKLLSCIIAMYCDLNSSTIICDGCRQEMIAHLEDHHKD